MIPKYEHPITKYNELAAKRRGEIINHTINLEKIMDIVIANHFIDNVNNLKKNKELEYMIIEGLPFSSKINTLLTILKKYHKDIFIAHPRLEKDLDKIRKNRNYMAHSYLDITETFVGKRDKNKLEMSKVIEKGNHIEFNENKINDLANLIIKYSHILMNW